ncbi:MAG: EAL domain-containing protein [Planctomycetaceae bacterium]|nr:EAL domain-containing protein [Planctomycetaceae bacterium]
MTTILAPTRILIVDDNAAIHDDFRKVLATSKADQLADDEQFLFGESQRTTESHEFEIDSAFQGEEGLAKVRAAARSGRPYTMAFIDVRMPPGWDGIETISRIWDEYPTLQIVICTAYSDYSWHEICERLPHRQNLLILKKPFDAIEVMQLAYALTEKARLATEVAQHVACLEQRIQERTLELQRSNQELKSQVAQREQAESHLQHLAFHDTLTGLANRQCLQHNLQESIELAHSNPSEKFAVMFVDLDRFKSINDGLGHEVGDELLKVFSSRIEKTLRMDDLMNSTGAETLAGRLGGDEFVIILKKLRESIDAIHVAERLLRILDRPYEIQGQTIHVSPSVGVVNFDPRYQHSSEMLRDADTAMYEAKLKGGDSFVVFEPSMQAAIQVRLSMEHDLRQAIIAGQFWLAYQPIWSVQDLSLQGVEALIRWSHPEKGMIRPDLFIPIAEQTKLIVPIGEWVLRESCAQFGKWKRAGLPQFPKYISVNLSRVQLMQPGLIDIVKSTLEESQMQGSELQFEVTESMIMEDPQQACKVISQLKSLGVRLAIDDFGTGHSSLACLHEFQLDVLKIDRSFVKQMNEGTANPALLNAIVRLAENLGLECVAEGVEEREQLQQLGVIGCPRVQGYLLGKPKSNADFVNEYLLAPHLSASTVAANVECTTPSGSLVFDANLAPSPSLRV